MRPGGSLAGRFLFLGVVMATACSSPVDPTGKGTEGQAGQNGAPATLQSFSAQPDAINAGEQFTLAWQGQNGSVSLARKGSGPFAVGLPASGSQVLASGAAGYPTDAGPNVYVAAIGDVVVRRETTVTLRAGSSGTNPPPGSCGDRDCGAGETQSNCCVDCGCPSGYTCTNGQCVQSVLCGNGNCDPGETCGCADCLGKPCDDGNACTVSDVCGNGSCQGTPKDCNDNKACTVDSCSNGTCTNTPKDCDDGDACTNDWCSGGTCYHAAKCDDSDACTNDSCSNGTCTYTPKCNDNTVCTTDSCSNGTCTNTPISCSDSNPCTNDTCDRVLGCQYPPKDCSDNEPCTNDSCATDGTCTHTFKCGGTPACVTCVNGDCQCGPRDGVQCGGDQYGPICCSSCSCSSRTCN